MSSKEPSKREQIRKINSLSFKFRCRTSRVMWHRALLKKLVAMSRRNPLFSRILSRESLISATLQELSEKKKACNSKRWSTEQLEERP
jgi:hypothetical protein